MPILSVLVGISTHDGPKYDMSFYVYEPYFGYDDYYFTIIVLYEYAPQ